MEYSYYTSNYYKMSDTSSDFSGFGDVDIGDVSDLESVGSDISVSSVHTSDLSDFADDIGSDSETNEENDDVGTVNFSKNLHDIDIEPFVPYPNRFAHALDHTATEMDFCKLFLDDDILDNFVQQTNLYAEQQLLIKPDPKWVPTTVEEMKAFLGMNMLMGIIVAPELDLYWSKKDAWGNALIRKTMSRDRFRNIATYLHLNDNDTAVPRGQQGHDQLHKIRPLLSAVQNNIRTQFNPGMNLAIDEAMVAFKGRSFLKQYLPSKPTKWGFKIWGIADSDTGYLSDISVYTGKRDKPSKHGLGHDVVMSLAERYFDRYHHVYFDNLFSSIPLELKLLKRKTYSCATVRSNRAGLPAEIKKPGKLARGQSVKMQHGNLTAVAWHDKRDVRLLATNSQPIDSTVRRRVGGGTEGHCMSRNCDKVQ